MRVRLCDANLRLLTYATIIGVSPSVRVRGGALLCTYVRSVFVCEFQHVAQYVGVWCVDIRLSVVYTCTALVRIRNVFMCTPGVVGRLCLSLPVHVCVGCVVLWCFPETSRTLHRTHIDTNTQIRKESEVSVVCSVVWCVVFVTCDVGRGVVPLRCDSVVIHCDVCM